MEFYARKTKEGKTQTVQEHLTATAKLCSTFAGKIAMAQTGYLLGYTHDLGKFSHEFQKRLFEKGEKCNHSTAGAVFINDYFSNSPPWLKDILEIILLSHHGGLLDMYDLDGRAPKEAKLNADINYGEVKQNAGAFLQQLQNVVSASGAPKEITEKFNEIKNKYPHKAAMLSISLLVKFLYSCLIDADRTDSKNFSEGVTNEGI